MVYVALLRGINVGGKNKVDMKQLKAVFEAAGMESVSTYINSGNVIFIDEHHKPAELVKKLETAIFKKFGFNVKVLLRDYKSIEMISKALPKNWQNSGDLKCDVMFLWQAIDNKNVLDKITIKPGIDQVKYIPGTLLWCTERKQITRSGLMRLASTDLYVHMTIRNCNTARKLFTLMQQANKV